MLDLIIRGGQVVMPHGAGAWDVGVKGETIVAIAAPGALPAANAERVIDASGKIVVPGGVDGHIHCKWPTRNAGEYSAPPAHVSRAALFGGTTTLVDFAVWSKGQTLQQAVELRDADWIGQCCCDYAYHLLLNGEVPPEVVEQLPEMIQAGYPSVKMYMSDVRPPRTGWKMHLGDIWEVLRVLAKHGGIACIHAEDDDLVMHMYRKLIREGRVNFTHMSEVHSTLSEDLSFRRIIRLAENIEAAAIYLMHVSARSGVEAIQESRSKGYPVYGETLHQYALFTQEDYRRPNGQIYHTYPSLKDKEDQDALWEGITQNGAISTISTDGICTPLAAKVRGDRIDNTTGGNVGVEPRLGVMYTEIVARRKQPLERFVDVTSANPARIMGLFPRKGAIAVGSDADITILDPAVKGKLRNEDLHESDYSPWEGYEVAAWPVITTLRGKIMVENGRFLGEARDGKRMARKLSDAILTGPAC
jgi:dihydropyrimidinase